MTEQFVICEDCGQHFPKRVIYEGNDPMIEKLTGQVVKVCLCPDCYREACIS